MTIDKKYLIKEMQRTIDESDRTATYCLCMKWILKDVLELLTAEKEEKPMPVVVHGHKWMSDTTNLVTCPRCGEWLDYRDWKYCPKCGQEVLWE